MMDLNKIIQTEGLLPAIAPRTYLRELIQETVNNGLPEGLLTGVDGLDEMIRLPLGTLAILTGYAGMGKSEFIDWLCCKYNTRYGHKILINSPENQLKLHIPKLISKITGKAYENLSSDERERATEYIYKNFFFFLTSQNRCIEDIIAEAERFIVEQNVKVFISEPFNSFTTRMSNGDIFNLHTICTILTMLRYLAEKYNILVIVSAHPTKPNDFTKPTGYNIAHSADFMNKADYLLGVHRKKDDTDVTIIVDKVRDKHYGKCGECKLSYDLESGNYFEYDEYDDDDAYEHEHFELPALPEKKEALDIEVSFYKGTTDAGSTDTINLKDFLMGGKFKDVVDEVRKGKTPAERSEIKNKNAYKIPCVTTSGTFSYRNSNHLVSHSGLMAIDIDDDDNSEDIMKNVPKILKELDFIAYVGKSITGDGYFAICKIDNPLHIEQHYYAMEAILADKGITLDNHCKDITRLRLASYDEDYYYNPNATAFYCEKEKSNVERNKKEEAKSQEEQKESSTDVDEKQLDKELENLKKNGKMLKDDYHTWFKLGMSLLTLGEEKGRYYFHAFSSLSQKYDKHECDEQFNKIISSYEENNEYTLGTVFYLIKETKANQLLN